MGYLQPGPSCDTRRAVFEVVVPPTSQSFVHQAVPGNTISNSTYLDNALTNGEPNAALSVTHNWNPLEAGASTTIIL